MPIKGKLLDWYRLEFSLSATASGDTKVWGAYGRTRYTPDTVAISDEIRVVLNASDFAHTFSASVSVNADTPVSASASGAYRTSASVTVTIKDLKVYNTVTNAGATVSWSGIDIVINGVTTSSGANTATYSGGTGPCYFPLVGVPWEIGADEASPYLNFLDGDAPGTLMLDIAGGWRFKETSGDAWTSLPVTIPASPVFDGGAWNLSDFVSVTDTSDGAIHCELELTGTIPATDGLSFPVRLCLLPDLTKEIERLSVDYRAIWYRAEFPQVTALDIRQMWDPPGGSYSEVGGESEIYPEESEYLQTVGDSAATIEDVFGEPTYAPVEVHAGQKVNFTVPFEIDSFVFPYDSATTWTNYLDHAEILPKYLSSWANPHWQLFLWWQNWDLDSAATDPADYWHPARTQWIWNSGLSAGDKRRTRNSFVLDCLNTESGISPFWDSFTDSLGWIGAFRWKAKSVTVRTTYTYDSGSSSLWTLTDCTASHGSDLVLTSTGASTIAAELNIGSYTLAPFMWAHWANKVFVDWVTTNISAVRVYLVGVDYDAGARPNARVLLKASPSDVATTRNTTYTKPVGTSEQYAGSWAIDNGIGVVTDTGTDTGANGISSATMADAERVAAFSLLAGYTAAKLRFEVDLVSTGSPATLKYPRFEYSLADDPQMIVETGQAMALVQSSGPGIRYGNTYYYSAGLNITPSVKGLGQVNTIIDALCWSRNWLEGKQADDGLTTELSSMFDTEEGQSVANADARSLGVLLPKTWTNGGIHTLDKTAAHLALVATQAELPPVAWMPWRKWGTAWAYDGDYTQTTWSWAQERRDFVSAGATCIHLFDGSTQWTSVLGGSLAGWKISSHAHALDNDETGFTIYYGATQKAEDIRPWHGHFFVDGNTVAATGLSYDVSFGARHWRAYVSSGTIRIGWTDNTLGTWADSDTGIAGVCPVLRIDRTAKAQRQTLTCSVSGSIKLYTREREIDSFTMATTIGTGDGPNCHIEGRNGFTYVYWLDGSTIKGQILDRAGNVSVSTFTVVASADSAGLACDESTYSQTQHRIVLLYYTGGTLTKLSSDDGVTFS